MQWKRQLNVQEKEMALPYLNFAPTGIKDIQCLTQLNTGLKKSFRLIKNVTLLNRLKMLN